MFHYNQAVIYEIEGGAIISGVITMTYDVPFVTIRDDDGSRYYAPTDKVTGA